jgi:hypothetical protein
LRFRFMSKLFQRFRNGGVDTSTETAARWLAARSTRRSFLAGVARVSMIGVGTKAVSAVLTDQAQARVCGQSGTSPMCPTYDCVGPDVVFGYCWYASPGCCANGGLKKICDCCGVGYKNVQGYCPEGSAVYCVVESCLEDPRVQSVPLERYVVADAVEASIAALIDRAPGSSPTVVLVTGDDPLMVAVAMPVAAELGVPLVACDRALLRPALGDELKRVGVRKIVVVGAFTPALLNSLEAFGSLDRVTTASDPAGMSIEVAKWTAQRTGFYESVCIGAGSGALNLAPVAGAYAAQRRRPLLISPDAVGAFLGDRSAAVALIGTEVATAVSRFGGSISINSDDPQLVSITVANRTLRAVSGTMGISFADATQSSILPPLAAGALVILVPQASNDALRDWLMLNRKRFSGAVLARAQSAPADDALVYALQSALNGYDAHLLSGNDGDGLPVFAQPLEEQALGAVRVTGPLPSTTMIKSMPVRVRKSGPPPPVGVQAPATAPARRAGPLASTSTLFVPKSSRPTIAVRGNRQAASTSVAPSATSTLVTTPSSTLSSLGTTELSAVTTSTNARSDADRPLSRTDP